MVTPLQRKGHAIEARIYAEDPAHDFLPTTGKIKHLSSPPTNENVRIDTGVQSGDTILPFYDPMIAKIICYGKDRKEAIRFLYQALSKTHLIGFNTNIPFLSQILNEPDFINGIYNTCYLSSHDDLIHATNHETTNETVALAAHLLFQLEQIENIKSNNTPWQIRDNLRINLPCEQQAVILLNQAEHTVTLRQENETYYYQINDQVFQIKNRWLQDFTFSLQCNKCHYDLFFYKDVTNLYFSVNTQLFQAQWQLKANATRLHDNGDKARFTAPMPGTIVNIHIRPGQQVEKGDQLLVIEAMKMEHTLFAPSKGVVKDVFFNIGDMIQEGMELLQFEANEE